MSIGRRLVFTNRKGGCGKTTTSVNIAAALAHMGNTVLVVDADPQAHATMSLGVSIADLESDLSEVTVGRASAEATLRDTYVPRLKVLPSSRRLEEFEQRFAAHDEAQSWMAERLGTIMDRFDYTIFDTPPTTQLLTMSALVASREAFVPMQAHFLAMEGMVEIVELVEQTQQRINPALSIRGIIPTFFEESAAFSQEIMTELRARLGDEVVLDPIRHNSALAEAPGRGRTIFQHDLRSGGALDYYRLAVRIRSLGPPPAVAGE